MTQSIGVIYSNPSSAISIVKKNKKIIAPVSIVIVHRNSPSTILKTLEGIRKQDYPIEEIIIVDNHSTEDSLSKIKHFSFLEKI